MPPRSLKYRLLLGFFVSMTAILTVGGFVIYKVTEKYIESENDQFLRERLAFFESNIWLRETRGAVLPYYRFVPHEWRNAVVFPLEAWMPDSGKVIPFPELPGTPRPRYALPHPVVKDDEVVFLNHTLEDGRKVRLCTKVFMAGRMDPALPATKVQAIVGRDRSSQEAALTNVRWVLVKIGLGVMAAVLLASALIIRRGVKPVNSLANQIEGIPLADEGARFALPGAPTELQPVVGRLNALMDRVGAAIEHERQFASNAAHELRNPLAAMRGKIELALSRTRKAEEYEEALENIWQSQQGMQRVVDHLLLLARLESGHQQSEFITEPAQLGRMLKKAWRGCIDNADERHLRVAWHVEDQETEFLASVSLLDIVFSNLLCNAANYTPENGEVRIYASLKNRECRVAVENTNPGLTEEMLERTFAPFWRADPNASGHRGNAGIGLALCRRIAMTLGGTITASLTPAGMVRYEVELPITSSPRQPEPESVAVGA